MNGYYNLSTFLPYASVSVYKSLQCGNISSVWGIESEEEKWHSFLFICIGCRYEAENAAGRLHG